MLNFLQIHLMPTLAGPVIELPFFSHSIFLMSVLDSRFWSLPCHLWFPRGNFGSLTAVDCIWCAPPDEWNLPALNVLSCSQRTKKDWGRVTAPVERQKTSTAHACSQPSLLSISNASRAAGSLSNPHWEVRSLEAFLVILCFSRVNLLELCWIPT